eukprot:4272460-Alexandrium_andersonii.AAC.1
MRCWPSDGIHLAPPDSWVGTTALAEILRPNPARSLQSSPGVWQQNWAPLGGALHLQAELGAFGQKLALSHLGGIRHFRASPENAEFVLKTRQVPPKSAEFRLKAPNSASNCLKQGLSTCRHGRPIGDPQNPINSRRSTFVQPTPVVQQQTYSSAPTRLLLYVRRLPSLFGKFMGRNNYTLPGPSGQR